MKLATIQAIGELLAADGVTLGCTIQVSARALLVLTHDCLPWMRSPDSPEDAVRTLAVHPKAMWMSDIRVHTTCGPIIVQHRLVGLVDE